LKKIIATAVAVTFALSAQGAFAEPFAGPYVGVEAGHDAYEVKTQGTDLGGVALSFDGLSGNGASGGLYAGYDLRVTKVAFVGVEAGVDYSGAKISAALTSGGYGIAGSIKARETYGIAARLGAKVSSVTGVYAKLGYAHTRFKTEAFSDGTQIFDGGRSKGAFVYGAGLETMLNGHFAVRAEFTVSDYGSAGLNDDLGINGIKISNSKTSLGVSYRF
jgi:outer membrane immunogenic protein